MVIILPGIELRQPLRLNLNHEDTKNNKKHRDIQIIRMDRFISLKLHVLCVSVVSGYDLSYYLKTDDAPIINRKRMKR